MQGQHLKTPLERVWDPKPGEQGRPSRRFEARGIEPFRGLFLAPLSGQKRHQGHDSSDPCHITPSNPRHHCKPSLTPLGTREEEASFMINHRHRISNLAAVALLAGLGLAGCVGETFTRGFVPSENALQQVPVGAPREQVLLALGTPSTTADFGGEVFYYISQTTNRPVAFMNTRVTDQKVLAVYFSENSEVTQIANYGIQEGKIFDFVSRTTPTAGRDFSFLSQLFSGAGRITL
jgi:outer membrane protein assembly factor BamE (lipoprotein component of BamABCDE complex)